MAPYSIFFVWSPVKTSSFSLHTMLIDGLEWCGLLVDYCDVFISCSDSHSDGTHSLQRIHWWASDGMLHFIKSVLMTTFSTSWMAWGRKHFQQIFIFGGTISLNRYKKDQQQITMQINARKRNQSQFSMQIWLSVKYTKTKKGACMLSNSGWIN